MIRHAVAECGFTEALTFTLCSCPDVAEKFGKNIQDIPAVHIANPKSLDFQVRTNGFREISIVHYLLQIGRTTLLPGLLKTIANNQGTALPIQLFEVSDVILKDSTRGSFHLHLRHWSKNFTAFLILETGSRNERRLCAVFYNRTPGFEVIHGLLDRMMTLVKIPYNDKKTNDHGYYLNNQCQGKIRASFSWRKTLVLSFT